MLGIATTKLMAQIPTTTVAAADRAVVAVVTAKISTPMQVVSGVFCAAALGLFALMQPDPSDDDDSNGGGGGGSGTSWGGGAGGMGGVRIIWGAGRSFPYTYTTEDPSIADSRNPGDGR